MIPDWDDLRVFLALVRDGKLTAVARRLGVSHPTVARRVKSLEDAIGARLFDRLPDRFVPTAAGEQLLADAETMEQAAEAIARRGAGLRDTARGTVRIAAGEAMTGFLADRLPELRHDLQAVELELVASHMLVNLSRREADLMIREQVPDLAGIVARRLGRVAYAIYGAASLEVPDTSRKALRRLPWVGFDEEHAYMPGQRWLLDLLDGARPVVRTNNWLVLRDTVRASAGLTLLPCYLADRDPALKRIGTIVPEVAVDQWLLVHEDLRALPRVRAVMDALVQLFQKHRAAIEGRDDAA
jgi:DNA-binding transcriptional LysR family regulator